MALGKFELGVTVKDTVTGFEGVAVACTDRLNTGRRPEQIPAARLRAIVALYEKGWTYRRIAKLYDRSHTWVRLRLIQAGAALRKPGGSKPNRVCKLKGAKLMEFKRLYLAGEELKVIAKRSGIGWRSAYRYRDRLRLPLRKGG